MQLLVRIALLATTAALVFLNPLYLGRGLYYALLVLLFALGLLFWYTSWRVGKKAAASHLGEPISYYANGSLARSLDERRLWGALVVGDEHIHFLVRKGKTVEGEWKVRRADVIHTAAFVSKRKKGLLLATEKEGRYFYTNKAEQVATLVGSPQNA